MELQRGESFGFLGFGRSKSRRVGKPQIPKRLRTLIREMAAENPTWGEEPIAYEFQLKLTIEASPGTVGRYLYRDRPVRTPDAKQRWLTVIRNHAKFVVACDFFVVITATLRSLYVFVVMEIGSRQILHHNVSAHPTAEWTLQQFREALPGDTPYRFVIQDGDRIFAEEVDKGLANLGVTSSADAGAIAEGELGMRAAGQEASSGVSRLFDSLKRTPSPNVDWGLGNPR